MTEENKDVQSDSTKDSNSSKSTPPPAIDVDSIVSKAEEAARKAVKEASKDISDAAVSAIADRFKGKDEGDEQKVHPLIREFAKDPEAVLEANRRLTLQTLAQADAQSKQDAETLSPILDEYPELRSKLDYIEFEAEKSYQKNPKLSREEHIKAGAQNAAKELGLKKLTEEEKAKRKSDAMIPTTGGGQPSSTERDQRAATLDFIKARTAAANAPRTKRAA